MRQTRLEDGCDIDVDAVVDCHVRQATGEATDARVYSDLIAAPRDVATALLLDSTSSLQVGGGRVFALELVCADALVGAMARTGERFGVFAFRGDTRHRVEVLVLRGFDDPPSTRVSRPELRPHGYTRLGAALRHVSARLQEVPAQRHILLSLGDGLPSDEGYEGAYAEADVAKAVEEATDAGIIVFHIGVGRVRRDPLVDMFGPVRSRRIKSSEELPDLLNDVYHALRGQ
jgi:nitric oxide reductase activation protein